MTRLQELLSEMPMTVTISDPVEWRRALVRETCEVLMQKFDDAAEIKGDMDDPMIMARNMIGFWMIEATKPAVQSGEKEKP